MTTIQQQLEATAELHETVSSILKAAEYGTEAYYRLLEQLRRIEDRRLELLIEADIQREEQWYDQSTLDYDEQWNAQPNWDYVEGVGYRLIER